MKNNDIVTLLICTFAIIIVLIVVLLFIYMFIKLKEKKEDKKEIIGKKSEPKEVKKEFNKQSIFKFMEFDNIRDNMIIQKDGKRFLMIIECQGINFDLMSGLEKNSVEQGFLQFLNTLRNPIQIYIQTRTVNLAGSIDTYKSKIENIEKKYRQMQMEYTKNVNSGQYTEEQLNKEKYELIRQQNLYEYGKDIINNTERMSLNKNILSKHYYIVISHYVEENPDIHYAKEEIANITFSELYTKAQAIINSLSVCGVNSKILDSVELAELLYVAYNRDDSEVFDLRRALNAGFEDMYSMAPDVYDKRIKELDKKIEEEAMKKANNIALEAIEETEKQKLARQKEQEIDFLIDEMVKTIINENKKSLGAEVAEKAIELVDKENKSKDNTGGKIDENKSKKANRRKTETNK